MAKVTESSLKMFIPWVCYSFCASWGLV